MRAIAPPEIEIRRRFVIRITDGCHASAVSACAGSQRGTPMTLRSLPPDPIRQFRRAGGTSLNTAFAARTICPVTRSTDGAAAEWLPGGVTGRKSEGAGEVTAAELQLAKLVPLLSLFILLAAAALAWSCGADLVR